MSNTGSDNFAGQALDNMTDGRDDPNRGPLDRATNAIGGQGGASEAAAARTSQGVVSAIFDSEDEARQAVSELRNAGITDASLSLISQRRGTTTTSNADGDVVDEEHSSFLRGILGGGALGAGLGVAALAIPGVGPLVAAGAIAASAVPSAMAIGAVAGAALGTLNETLKSHGVSDEDVTYYGERMGGGGVLVTVDLQSGGQSRETVEEILYSAGGHNSARSRQAAL